MSGFDGDYVRYIASAGMESDIDPTGASPLLFPTLQQMAQRIIALEEGRPVKRTLWGILQDEDWSMDIYSTVEEAMLHRVYDDEEVLPLVKITEEVVDYGTWVDLAEGGVR